MERSRSSRHGGESSYPPARRQQSQTSSQNSAPQVGARAGSLPGGNIQGESASVHSQRRPSPAPTQSPVHDVNDRINERAKNFLKQYSIRWKINEATYNRAIIQKDFVTDRKLRDVWRHYFSGFLTVLGSTPIHSDLEYIWENLIEILSILVVIRWREWHRFSHIFLESMRDPHHSRLDRSIPYTLDELSQESFLGDMAYDFYQRQYAFKPIVIEGGEAKEYPSWTRTPFIFSESKELGHGNYGIVTKEAIAPYQFKPKNSGSTDANKILVARKLLMVQSDFRREKDNLFDLNSSLSNHEHIVRYLAIIIIGDSESPKQFNILMPLASMNLETFLYSEDAVLPRFQIKDLLQQAANMADAIRWLHGGLPIKDRIFICCHMDLKLDNILVYLEGASEEEPVGKWKIADFGISTLKEPEEPEEPRARRTHLSEKLTVESPAHTLARLTARIPAVRAPAAFQAPEVFKGSEIGRSSDVWSFGCILFQILARGVGPSTKKLRELDRLRFLENDKVTMHVTDYFFRERGPNKYLNPHAKDWLEEGLPGGSWQDRYFVKSCKYIILKILNIDPTARLKAYQVNDRLWAMLKGPDAATFSEVQAPSSSHRTSLTVPVPGISITPAKEQDDPPVLKPSTLVPSATVNGPFDSWEPMVVTSVTPCPETQPNTIRPSTVAGRSKPSSNPSVPTVNAANEPQSRQNLPNHYVQSLQDPQSPQPTWNAPFVAPNPYSPPIDRQGPQPTWNDPFVASSSYSPPDPLAVGATFPAGAFDNTPTRSQPFNQDLYSTQSQASSSSRTPTAQGTSGRGSTSRLSNRSDSLRSSTESRASIEAVPYDTNPFGKLKDVVLQAMISSMSGNVAFIRKKAISIRAISGGPTSYFTFGTENFEWECGSMAGDWLIAVGYYTAAKSNKERVFRLYKVSTNGILEPPHLYRVAEPLPHVNHAVISWEGRLIFKDRSCAWIYSSYNDNSKKQLVLKSAQQTQSQFGNAQGIAFGNNGSYAFVKTTIATNYFRIGVWHVSDPGNLFTSYEYQRERQDLTAPIPTIIPFPSLPFCVLWDENGKVWFLHRKGLAPKQPTIQRDNLQAIAISSDENFVVFVRSIKHKSEMSIFRLHSENETFTLEEKASGIKLDQSLSHPRKSAVEMQATTVGLRVIIAHCDGTHEIKEVSTVGWT